MGNKITELEAINPENVNRAVNLGQTANKELYIVVAEDPTTKTKYRAYITTKTNAGDPMLKFIGYEITKNYSTVMSALKNTNIVYPDALELVKKHSEDLESLDLPWHRIIRVKTIKFAEKKQ